MRLLIALLLAVCGAPTLLAQDFDAESSVGTATIDALSGISNELEQLLRTLTFRGEAPPPSEDGYRLFANPDDVDVRGIYHPLNGRVPVVVLHGYSRYYVKMMNFAGQRTWRSLRSAVKRSRRNVVPGAPPRDSLKFVFYYYQPTKPYPELATELAERLVEAFALGKPEGPEKILFLAHSAGAILARYASMAPELAPFVGGIVTLAGAHRGSIQASLATAHGLAGHPDVPRTSMEEIQGVRDSAGVDAQVFSTDPAVRLPCDEDPVCAVLASIAYDNYDGAVSESEQEDLGILVNDTLREFNEGAPMASRIIAYHGDVTDLGTRRRRVRQPIDRGSAVRTSETIVVPTDRELQRRALEAVVPAWANADPVVHFESGTFADSPKPLLAIRTFPNVGHHQIFSDRAVLAGVLEDLEWLAGMPLPERALSSPPEAPAFWDIWR
jgi:hypothetical protein